MLLLDRIALVTLLLLLSAMELTLVPVYAANDPEPNQKTVYLWPTGAPTLKGTDEKETFTPPDAKPGERFSIKNVHNPLIEVHLPTPDSTKPEGGYPAILIAPGGGHKELVWYTEGRMISEWLNKIGVETFVLKYRLAQTPGYSYTVEGEALQDTQRALRMIHARAGEWGVDPHRVGILGFSAGGALAALSAMRYDDGNVAASDAIERQSSRPDFVGMVYAGWGKGMAIKIPTGAPPVFLTSAGVDDASHARQTVEFYNALFDAKIPVELHIYGHGGHGNGIRDRDGIPFGTWHRRFEEWMIDLGLLKRAATGK